MRESVYMCEVDSWTAISVFSDKRWVNNWTILFLVKYDYNFMREKYFNYKYFICFIVPKWQINSYVNHFSCIKLYPIIYVYV